MHYISSRPIISLSLHIWPYSFREIKSISATLHDKLRIVDLSLLLYYARHCYSLSYSYNLSHHKIYTYL